MTLSICFLFNKADAHVLQCSGFPMDRINEIDEIYELTKESLVYRLCSLVGPVILEQEDYSTVIAPQQTLVSFKEEIDFIFNDVEPSSRQTLWTIACTYLWKICDHTISEIQDERRFRDFSSDDHP
jgi:hypothetical protein